jgi:hypothetical protein
MKRCCHMLKTHLIFAQQLPTPPSNDFSPAGALVLCSCHPNRWNDLSGFKHRFTCSSTIKWMAFILESSSIVDEVGDYSEGTSTSRSDFCCRTKSRRPKQAATQTQLCSSHLNDTVTDVSLDMDDLFDSMVTHGSHTILSRLS